MHLSIQVLLVLCIIKCACGWLTATPLFVGFDFGTSGVRSCVIRSDSTIVHEQSLLWKDLSANPIGNDPVYWTQALNHGMNSIPEDLRRHVARISVSGTSATTLLYDTSSKSITRGPAMYDYSVLAGEYPEQGQTALDTIRKSCPSGSATNAATSTLAKLLMWHFQQPLTKHEILLHQADYIVKDLVRLKNDNIETFCTDWNNCLKLGYDINK